MERDRWVCWRLLSSVENMDGFGLLAGSIGRGGALSGRWSRQADLSFRRGWSKACSINVVANDSLLPAQSRPRRNRINKACFWTKLSGIWRMSITLRSKALTKA